MTSRIRPGSRTDDGSARRASPGALRRLTVACVAAVVAVGATSGCVTIAEHRKLERKVIDMQRGRGGGQGQREEVADLVAELESTNAELRALSGRVEALQKTADDALREAQKARRAAAGGAVGDDASGIAGGAAASPAPGGASASTGGADAAGFAAIVPSPSELEGGSPDELRAYQAGLTAWRNNDYAACIDRFRSFLQTYASSSRADDAAFWIGDCHYRQGEFKQAVLRFDDVSRNYPTGNRAPDAVYRQGESLLRLGPAYYTAARKAFERVVNEYPNSARAVEARKQLELRAPG